MITTVGSDDKIEKAKALGADHVINYREERFEGVVRKLTKKEGVDVVFEHVGPDTFAQSMFCLKRGGMLVTCGSTTGVSTARSTCSSSTSAAPPDRQLRLHRSATSATCSSKMADGIARPVIDSVIALDEIDAALARHGIAQRLRQDHRNAVSATVKEKAPPTEAAPETAARGRWRASRRARSATAASCPRPRSTGSTCSAPRRRGARPSRRRREFVARQARPLGVRRAARRRRHALRLRMVEGGGPRPRARGRPAASPGRLRASAARTGSPRRISPPPIPRRARRSAPRILAGVWENLGRQSVEYAFLQELVDGFDPERPGEGPLEVVGLEHVNALRDSGKPAILFGAHLGNFELTPALGAKLGLPVTAPLPAAGQSAHRRGDREPAEQLSRQDGGVRARRGARSGRRAEEGPAHRRAHRPADRRRPGDPVLQPADADATRSSG